MRDYYQELSVTGLLVWRYGFLHAIINYSIARGFSTVLYLCISSAVIRTELKCYLEMLFGIICLILVI